MYGFQLEPGKNTYENCPGPINKKFCPENSTFDTECVSGIESPFLPSELSMFWAEVSWTDSDLPASAPK